MSGPLVFLGETRAAKMLEHIQKRGWGRMWVERTPKPMDGEPWAFDNGAFACFLAGKPFDTETFLRRLDRATAVGMPYLAVTPDRVGGGGESLEFSLGWRDELPDEWPWYLAVQDGMTPDDVSPCLDRFAGIFLGGTTRFKSTAQTWCDLAHLHGKQFHYGRASVLSRIDAARVLPADSLDTAFPLWTYERLNTFTAHFLRSPYEGQLAVGPGAMSPRR